MAQAFLHGEQDVRIAARLDIDYTIGMQPREMECGREQVTPPQAPEDRTFHPREDAGEKDRRARIVGKIGTAGDLMQRAARYATARQAGVDGLQPERNRSMASAHAFDLRDARSQIFDDAGFAHNIQKTRAVDSFAICSIQSVRESSVGGVSILPPAVDNRLRRAFAGRKKFVRSNASWVPGGYGRVMAADFHLDRFVTAQATTYDTALAEIRRGAKRSHWMWFIFPQIAGLGTSDMARRYAIGSLDEARAYLAHPLLGLRLRDCVGALQDLTGTSAIAVFGEVDAMKLRSCLTLFAEAGGGPLFVAALERWFDGAADAATLAKVGSSST